MTQANMSKIKSPQMADYEYIQNLDYIRKPKSSTEGNGGITYDVYGHDNLSSANSSLTPSIHDPLAHLTDDDGLGSDGSTDMNESGQFLSTLLSGPSPGRKISYREHKELMRALNDKWECELDRVVRQSEELLYEQAKVVEDDQGILADRHMKEALDQAKEKEKAALRMEAKLRDEYRELKLQLDEELNNREEREDKLESPTKRSGAGGIGAAKKAIQRYCLAELNNALSEDFDVTGEVSDNESSIAHDSFRKEIRGKVRNFQNSVKVKTNNAILEAELSLQKENAAALEKCKEQWKSDIEELTKAHEAKTQELHQDAERDREHLISDMKQSFEESMSRALQKKAGCLRF